MVIEAVDIPVIQIGAAFIQGRGGDAGGNHEQGIHRQVRSGRQHVVDAVCAHDVGDFMGIGDDGGSAVGNHRPGKFAGGDQAGFQMNVGIDEAGADHLAGHIHFFHAIVSTQTHNESFCNGDVAFFQSAGKDIDVGGVLQNQIRFFQTGGHTDDVLFPDQPAVDFTGPCFGVTHRIDLLDLLQNIIAWENIKIKVKFTNFLWAGNDTCKKKQK